MTRRYEFRAVVNGRVYRPKGFYYQGRHVILVGDADSGHTIRAKHQARDVDIEVSLIKEEYDETDKEGEGRRYDGAGEDEFNTRQTEDEAGEGVGGRDVLPDVGPGEERADDADARGTRPDATQYREEVKGLTDMVRSRIQDRFHKMGLSKLIALRSLIDEDAMNTLMDHEFGDEVLRIYDALNMRRWV